MPARNGSHPGTLDLSQLAEAPQKVKLPDGRLYDMANPAELGVLPQQRLIARYRRAQELMRVTDASEAEAEEMVEMLLDVAQVVVPDAPREVLGRLGLPQMERLASAFWNASPASTSGDGQRAEAAPKPNRRARRTSAG